MSTKYLAAYALLVLSGDETPSDEKIAKVFIEMGIRYDMDEIQTLTRHMYIATQTKKKLGDNERIVKGAMYQVL